MFSALTEGPTTLPGGAAGLEQFLAEYLGTPDEVPPFGGRASQLADLDRWLAEPDFPYALMVAPAGRGKSALLVRWAASVAERECAEVALAPISIRFGTASKHAVLSQLGMRLRYLHAMVAPPPAAAEAWLEEIGGFLSEDHPEQKPLLVAIDGIDEAAGWRFEDVVRFPLAPGRGVKVLVSARQLADRDAPEWLQALGWNGHARLIELPPLDEHGVGEILLALGSPLARLAFEPEIVDELVRLSAGDPLLVRLYVDALRHEVERATSLSVADLASLEPGLEGYFKRWWEEQERQWGDTAQLRKVEVRALLSLLACALAPLSREDAVALMEEEGLDAWTLEDLVKALERIVLGDGKRQGYVFTHPRLGHYFREEKLTSRERKRWNQRFLDYGRETLDDLNGRTLSPDDAPPYVVEWYGAHLERHEGDRNGFCSLVTEGWLRAWEAREGGYDGFLNDLERAGRQAYAAGANATSDLDRAEALGLQCRYALIRSSIKSLSAGLPPRLLAALVSAGQWTLVRALTYAHRAPDPAHAEALVLLAPHLAHEPALVANALAASRGIGDEELRAKALAALAPRLAGDPGLLAEALAAARAINDEFPRVEALVALAPHLAGDSGLLAEALAAARAIDDDNRRVEALVALAPHLAGSERAVVLAEALEATREIGEIEWFSGCADALVALAPHLAADECTVLRAEALDAARAIDNDEYRARALAALAPHLAAGERALVLAEALDAARAIDGYGRVLSLLALAPHLADDRNLLAEAVVAARETERQSLRAEALVALAPHVPADECAVLIAEALEDAGAEENGPNRAEALVALAPHLAGDSDLLAKAFAAGRAIRNEDRRVEALVGLAPHLAGDPGLVAEALAAARAIDNEEWRVEALVGLVPSVTAHHALFAEALDAARRVGGEALADWLVALARHLAEEQRTALLEEALEAARSIESEHHRAEALVALAPHLMEDQRTAVLNEALEAARIIGDEDRRAETLVALALRLPDNERAAFLAEAIQAARTIELESVRAAALTALAPCISEGAGTALRAEALEATRLIDDKYLRVEVLVALAPQLAGDAALLAGALDSAQAIGDEEFRVKALIALAPHLEAEPDLLAGVLEAARAIGHQDFRAHVIAALAPQLAKEPALLARALEAVGAITAENESARAEVLVALAPDLVNEPGLLAEALKAARAMVYDDRVQVLEALVPDLANERALLRETLHAARAIDNDKYRARVLAALAPHLATKDRTAALAGALEAAKAVGTAKATGLPYQDRMRGDALAALAPYLAGERTLLPEALEATREIEDDGSRAEALVALAPHLAQVERDAVLGEAFEATREIKEEGSRSKAFGVVAPQLTADRLAEAFEAVREIDDEYSRAEALVALAPHLGANERSAALAEALQAAREIDNAEERAEALVAVAPQLAVSERAAALADALEAAGLIEDEHEFIRTQALEALAPHLASDSALLAEALRAARAIDDEGERALVFAALAPGLERLARPKLYDLLSETLAFLALRTRGDLLSDFRALAPVLVVLGDCGALPDTIRAITEAGGWFP
jgi:hypothetical protein